MNKKELIDMSLKKLEKESNLSWEDISLLSGSNFSADHMRKVAYGIKFYDDFLKENMQNSCDFDEELDKKLIEIKKMKQRLSDERTFTNQKIRSLARIEDFIEIFREELREINEKKPLIVGNKQKNVENSDNAGVLLLSDVHYGIDDYIDEKFKMLSEKVIKYGKANEVKELYVFSLGDMISGHIHNTLRLENRQNVVEQIVKVSECISEFLFALCMNFDKVTVTFVGGNHDRVLPKKEDNLNKDSFNTLIKELVVQRTRLVTNLLVDTENIDKSYSHINIKGFECFGIHGDKDSPNNCVEGLRTISGVVPQYVFMGHYHNANEYSIGQSEVIVNGSFNGADEYALNIRKCSKPIQKFMIFNTEGRLNTYNINMELNR